MLASRTFGHGQRIVFVHGFTQTKETWNHITALLESSFEIVTVDAPNHGESSDISLTLEMGAKEILAIGDDATYVGYSLGGRFCLTAAITSPSKIKRLVLVSTNAGIQDKELRDARVSSDEALAKRIEQIGVSRFIDEWLTNPMFGGLTAQTDQREIRLANSAIGLSSSLRLCGAGKQQPAWTKLKDLQMPVLVIAGAKDEKYFEYAHQMVDAIGSNATLEIIADCGHTPHLEKPAEFVELVSEFVRKS